MLADAEMFCPARRGARWISRAAREREGSGGYRGGTRGGSVNGTVAVYQFLFTHVRALNNVDGDGCSHNLDTAFWFDVHRAVNSSGVQLWDFNTAEVDLSKAMARWWVQFAAVETTSGMGTAPGESNRTHNTKITRG